MIPKIIALLEGRLDVSKISNAELARLVRSVQLKGSDAGLPGVVKEYDRRRKPSRLKFFNAPSNVPSA